MIFLPRLLRLLLVAILATAKETLSLARRKGQKYSSD
jgi:hypothetical protein